MLTKTAFIGAKYIKNSNVFTHLIYFKMQWHYSSLQYHIILQKSFLYADLLLRKHFLKTCVKVNNCLHVSILGSAGPDNISDANSLHAIRSV